MKILERLNPTNTGSYNRPIAHALGLAAAVVYAALISKQVYYEQHNMLDEEGFFYSTIADLEESTTLTKRQQRAAIKVLIDKGLIKRKRCGMTAKRYFRVLDDTELIDDLLKQGEAIMNELNPIAQKCENVTSCSDKIVQQEVTNCNIKLAQNVPYTINNNINKSKENNPNQSIQSGGDRIDMMDNSTGIVSADERSNYLELIRENIEYDCFEKEEQEKVDELVEIMVDVVCSTKETIRVNKEDVPHGVVKSRFLKLTYEHIDYVLLALKRNTSDVKNIRAFLITTLYNAPTTMDAFIKTLVNHDMYGQCLDNIKGIINELNSMFSMLIELLTNDSLLQTTTTSLPALMSAIKATALTLCVMFFLIDFFTKSLHLQWVTWENVLMLFIKLVVAKVCVDNAELFTTMLYRGFNSFINAISGTITQYSFISGDDMTKAQYFVSASQASQIVNNVDAGFLNFQPILLNLQISIQGLINAELTTITEQMEIYEGRILSDTLRKKGIDLSEVTAAIEAGLFDKPPVSPTPTPTQTEGATYSTDNNNVSDKEDINEVSDS